MNEGIDLTKAKTEEEIEQVPQHYESALSRYDLEVMYKDAVKEMDRFRPNLEDFLDDYPPQDVLADINKSDFLEREWKEGEKTLLDKGASKRFGTLAEYVLFNHLRTWSRGKMQTVMPSRFDDYVRGIDLILEFPESQNEQSKYQALSVDVVLGAGERFIEKMMYIKKYVIDEGRTKNGPKYFKPDGKNVRQGFMVPGVIAFSRGALDEILVQQKDGEQAKIDKSITPHIVVIQLLEQYKGFEAYARSVGQEEIANAFKQAHEDLEDAASHLLGDLAFNPKMNDVVDAVPAVKNIKRFFKLLAEGEYLEDAKHYAEAA